jgi:phosphohistidine phosphatase
MELIFWRHADAEDGKPDLARRLTPKGRAQAARIAAWIREYVPPGFELIASPAVRAQETAQALEVPFDTSPLIAPGAVVASILTAAGWPNRPKTAILVGHQPDLGRAAAFLLCGLEQDWHIEKGALWWLAGGKQVFIKAVASPDLL